MGGCSNKNSDKMNPINNNQEQRINKAFIIVLMVLAVAQIFNIIIHI